MATDTPGGQDSQVGILLLPSGPSPAPVGYRLGGRGGCRPAAAPGRPARRRIVHRLTPATKGLRIVGSGLGPQGDDLVPRAAPSPRRRSGRWGRRRRRSRACRAPVVLPGLGGHHHRGTAGGAARGSWTRSRLGALGDERPAGRRRGRRRRPVPPGRPRSRRRSGSRWRGRPAACSGGRPPRRCAPPRRPGWCRPRRRPGGGAAPDGRGDAAGPAAGRRGRASGSTPAPSSCSLRRISAWLRSRPTTSTAEQHDGHRLDGDDFHRHGRAQWNGLPPPALVGAAVPGPLDDAGAVGALDPPLTSSTLPLWPAVNRRVPSQRSLQYHRWLGPPFHGHWTMPAPSAMDAPATSSTLPLWPATRRTLPSPRYSIDHRWLTRRWAATR